MSFFKLNGGACVALVALAMLMLMASYHVAQAAPTTLVCTGNNATFTLDLNEAKGTVTNNYPAAPLYPGSPQTFPARTEGPFPATFDSKTIAWDCATESDKKASASIRRPSSLDRMTGILQQQVCDQTGCSGIYNYNCHRGEQQF